MIDRKKKDKAVAQENGNGENIGVGALLRASRERCGEDLRTVAKGLRIRYVYLEAIEKGEYASLPGTTYAVGFVRAYSDYLALDSDEVVRRFKTEYAQAGSRTELHFPTPVAEHSTPSGAIVFLGMICLAIAYGAWYYLSEKDRPVADLVPGLPDRLASMVAKDKAKDGTATTEEKVADEDAKEGDSQMAENKTDEPSEQAAPAESAAVDSEQAPPTEPSANEPEEKPTAEEAVVEKDKAEPVLQQVAPTPTAQADKPQAVPAETAEASVPTAVVEPEKKVEAETEKKVEAPVEKKIDKVAEAVSEAAPAETAAPAPVVKKGPMKIVVNAKADSWIQVRDTVNDEMLLTRLLRGGTSYDVPNRPGLVLSTGNAGALDITVDGKSVPSLGGAGTVRRNVALDAKRLLAGKAVGE